MRMSQAALDRLTKPWEEFVAYPYDDKVPKHAGKYPEWTGGPARGTITVGFGHTDAAGAPKIVPGMRVTLAEATDILANDISPCERAVERLVKVPLGQNQFDCLVDAVFNFGAGTLQKSTLLKKLNAGDYGAVPAELMKYTYSKGERMLGLVHRRQAEIALWNAPDDKPQSAKVTPADHGVDDDDVMVPKATRPPVRSPLDSKSITAAGTAVLGTVTAVGKSVQDATQPLRDAQDQLQQLGIWDTLVAFASGHPTETAAAAGVIALLLFIIGDRWRRLPAETA